MLLEYTSTVDKPSTIAAARRTIELELTNLRAERDKIDAEIAKREQFLAASDALFPTNGKAPAQTVSLDAIPRTGYGALTAAVRAVLQQNEATTKQLTATLHKAGFLKDPTDPTPVRTVIKGLRKRGQQIAHDPTTGAYRIPN